MVSVPEELSKRVSYGYGVLITDTPTEADTKKLRDKATIDE